MKKLFSYTKYFLYLAYNWNISIAWHIIRQEIKGEKKYGIDTTGADELKRLEEAGVDISHATIYMPASYALLEEIFEQLNRQPFRHLLDMGCGKGRALCVAAHYGFKKLTGIDLSKELCTAAKTNMKLTKRMISGIDFSIINNDAFYFEIPDDVDCLFLFNPFDEVVMSAVAENLVTSLLSNPRKVNIIYINPLHKSFFLQVGFTETWYCKKMKYLEAVIMENK